MSDLGVEALMDVLGNTSLLDLNDGTFENPLNAIDVDPQDGAADNIWINFNTQQPSGGPETVPNVDDINGFGVLSPWSSPPPNTPDAIIPDPDFRFESNIVLEQTGVVIPLEGGAIEAQYVLQEKLVINFGDRGEVDLNGDGMANSGDLTLTIPAGSFFLAEYIGPNQLPPVTPPQGPIELEFESFGFGNELADEAYWTHTGEPNTVEPNITSVFQAYAVNAFELIAESLQGNLANIGDWAFEAIGVFYEPAMLGDFVWEDLDADGIQDADELDNGINGVTVKLLADSDGDGEIDDVVQTTVTSDNPDNGLPGWYKFTVAPGEYKVMFNNPDDTGPDAYMFSPRQVGGDPAVDSDGPMSDVVVLASGDFNDTIDAGLFRKGSIHVFGFLDEDGDGVQDDNEGAFPDDPGKTFELLDQSGDVIMTDSTMDGMVWFEQLTPGTYTVRENPIPDGFALTTLPNERTFTILSGQELVYEDGAAMLPDGDQRTEVNLGDDLRWGNAELAMIGDFVWEDLNADGIQDAGEPGIDGVTVKLLVGDQVVATTTTGDNPATPEVEQGFYKFNDLTPGVEYKVMFNNPDPDGPDAYMFSPRQVGDDPAVDSDGPMSDPIVLAPGEFNDTIDAGLFRKGSIHVFGFLDENEDGILNDNEGAFPDDPGKTFELLDSDGNVITSATTVDGMVWFEQLTPGTYSVQENPIPNGFFLTTEPNLRTFSIISGEELVYADGAAMLPDGDQRFETNLGDELLWGNAMVDDFDGCTPGFWKSNAANFDRKPDKFGVDTDGDGINDAPAAWAPTGVAPGDPLLSVGFDGFTVLQGDETEFVDALAAKGGGENALMRHAAAAYLNAAHPFITYRLSTDEIVDSVNAALGSGDRHIIEDLKDDLDKFNNAGCNIDQFGRVMEEHSMYS